MENFPIIRLKYLKLQIKVDFLTQKEDKFRPMFKSPLTDWCKLNDGNGNSKLGPFLKIFLNSIKKSAPHLIHNCPYSGYYAATNLSLQRDFIAFFPTGVYKCKLVLLDGISEDAKFYFLFSFFDWALRRAETIVSWLMIRIGDGTEKFLIFFSADIDNNRSYNLLISSRSHSSSFNYLQQINNFPKAALNLKTFQQS